MSKYIDAEKLKYEIERFKATEYGDNTFGDDVANGALDYVLEEIIPSLQQEQPEVDLEKEFTDFLEKENAYVDDNSKISYYNGSSFDHTCDIYPIARHFFNLGLNARKEK